MAQANNPCHDQILPKSMASDVREEYYFAYT
jgi:hypothetical protein